MGREAFVEVSYAGRSATAKALLEPEGIVIRRPIGLTIRRDAIRALAVQGGDLTGQGDQGPFRLSLGPGEALKWKSNLEAPLPTLAEKMGLKPGLMVWRFGDLDIPEIRGALSGTVDMVSDAATLGVARVVAAGDIDAVIASSPSPVWIVNDKGRDVAFGDAAIRSAMRRAGWIDTKSCAVSAGLSATRYRRR